MATKKKTETKRVRTFKTVGGALPVVLVGVSDGAIEQVIDGVCRRVFEGIQDPNFLQFMKLVNQLHRL